METNTEKRWTDPHSLCVVNEQGGLRRLYCPFRVRCTQAVAGIAAGSWAIVEEVHPGGDNTLLYLIQGRALSHHSFCIEIGF